MSAEQRHTNIFYRLTVIPVVALIVTVFALMAALMGNPAAPAARFLDRYAGVLIAVEVILSLLLGLIAVAVDRRAIERERRREAGTSPDDTTGMPKTDGAPARGEIADEHGSDGRET